MAELSKGGSLMRAVIITAIVVAVVLLLTLQTMLARASQDLATSLVLILIAFVVGYFRGKRR